ncbi:fumarylacetoacetate hydrolase family protein [Micromonospora fiedleri]|uniref:Fumarylacetoacetate hydrolase family protein n=1 Tax=Micromonospora fiedleri TaxID=1157498 RepID=A0ABS1UWE6_9ACTN|nr:fumarylacetoacetate hydrolase family protein [Micromonospora fiedleri]MBL6279205.1 fumarylacetoacetate hydrolase family protein [Micromonospora fiedleri]
MSTDIKGAAAALRQAYASGVACKPLRDDLVPTGDLTAAYAVQQAQVSDWLAEGRRLVGAKVGLTSRAVQEAFGVFHPDFGVLFADMAVPDGAEIDPRTLLQPRVEAEVAFVLGRDLPYDQVTVADVVRATDHLLPAIEIVDSRIANWDISIVDTVADNASSGKYVLGTSPRRLGEVDLRLCGAVLEQGGEPVSVGAGAACLGNPLHAVAWLAGTLAANGRPLRAGDTVLSGALGPMVAVTPGAAYEARISGLGSVRACFSKGGSS